MKTALRTLLVTFLGLSLVALPVLPDGALRAFQVDERRVDLAFATEGGGAWISTPIEGEATIAGLTWADADDAPEQAEIRIQVDGEWGDWEVVPVDDEHAPDPASSESASARGGTAPIVVEGAEAVQFRVSDATPPGDLAADLVDVDDPDASKRVRERPGAAEASPVRPSIHPRSDWGGESCPGPDRDPIAYGDRVHTLFVHHTASHTSYAKSDVPSIVRGICSYHVNGRGWSDIGYNALIDRYGGIWVGRDGGIAKHVIGAHTGGFNSLGTGVALIGDHHNGGAPTTAAQDALVRYAAWKLDVHSVDPTGRSTVTSGGSSKYSEGTRVTLDNISGHRDASYTACPGSSCYTLLPQIRTRTDAIGGFRIFGGYAQKHTMKLQQDGTWEHPVFSFRLTHPGSWTFQVRDRDGRVLFQRKGSGTGPHSIEWGATIDGREAPKDGYRARIVAQRSSDGARARTAVHDFELGGVVGDFDDVPSSNTFHDAIEWLARERITLGCNPPTNTRFCPGDNVNREQMAAFLDRALDLPKGTVGTFRDVPADDTFAQAIANLARAGITQGCNPPANDRFCPDQPVTRQQMAGFIVRGYDLRAMDHPGFRDVSDRNPFRDAIRRLATAGVTLGCNPPDNDLYCPTDLITRQQMAGFLRRTPTR